jgi:hypothetical protein
MKIHSGYTDIQATWTLQRREIEWPDAYLVEAALSEGVCATLRKVEHLMVRVRCYPHLLFPLHLQSSNN